MVFRELYIIFDGFEIRVITMPSVIFKIPYLVVDMQLLQCFSVFT